MAPLLAVAEIDSTGGVVDADVVRLEIPEGAVTEPVVISIREGPSAPGPGLLTKLYRFEPEGIEFEEAVTVYFESGTELPEGAAVVWTTKDDPRLAFRHSDRPAHGQGGRIWVGSGQ